jgi:Ser/Thr protein kinase RdoA (MazF antagonist)
LYVLGLKTSVLPTADISLYTFMKVSCPFTTPHVAHVQAGYTSGCKLSSVELEAVPHLIKGRIALSLANGAYSVEADPSNAEYLLRTQQPGFHLLQQLHSDPVKLRKVCLG